VLFPSLSLMRSSNRRPPNALEPTTTRGTVLMPVTVAVFGLRSDWCEKQPGGRWAKREWPRLIGLLPGALLFVGFGGLLLALQRALPNI
jgi:hypothetical protein